VLDTLGDQVIENENADHKTRRKSPDYFLVLLGYTTGWFDLSIKRYPNTSHKLRTPLRDPLFSLYRSLNRSTSYDSKSSKSLSVKSAADGKTPNAPDKSPRFNSLLDLSARRNVRQTPI
jgi:hypothetical protein